MLGPTAIWYSRIFQPFGAIEGLKISASTDISQETTDAELQGGALFGGFKARELGAGYPAAPIATLSLSIHAAVGRRFAAKIHRLGAHGSFIQTICPWET
jgi:hypothetical protein